MQRSSPLRGRTRRTPSSDTATPVRPTDSSLPCVYAHRCRCVELLPFERLSHASRSSGRARGIWVRGASSCGVVSWTTRFHPTHLPR